MVTMIISYVATSIYYIWAALLAGKFRQGAEFMYANRITKLCHYIPDINIVIY